MSQIRGRGRASTWILALACVVAGLLAARPVTGNEVDQFSLPPPGAPEMVDMGFWTSAYHYRLLDHAVKEVNREVDRALKESNEGFRKSALAHAHSPQTLANAIRSQTGPGLVEIDSIEALMTASSTKKQFPGKIVCWEPDHWIYDFTHFPLDPRNAPLLFHCGMIKVFGIYIGVDKIGHGHDLGHLYFTDYTSARRSGKSEQDALKAVWAVYVDGPISEKGSIGIFATGVASNGDLAANYLGFKFYRNLAETVMLKGRPHPPLLERRGEYWKLADYVRDDPYGFMEPFYSDHLNEAFNPSLFSFDMRDATYRNIEKVSANCIAFYKDENGQTHPRRWYADKAKELSTYYGEYYGHTGFEDVKTIAESCFGNDGKPLVKEIVQKP